MIGEANWEEGNSRYLSAALHWLRLRLERQLGAPTLVEPEPMGVRRRKVYAADSAEDAIQQAARDMAEAESRMDPPPALALLRQRLNLSAFEQDVVLLCAAMEFDTSFPSLCARANGDSGRPYPTFALALAISDEPAWDALSPERALRYWRLIEINQPGGQPLTSSPLRADERIVSFIKGLNYLDDRLVPFLTPIDTSDSLPELPPSQGCIVRKLVRSWSLPEPISPLPVIQLVGSDSRSKQMIARHATAEFARCLYRMPIELLPSQPADLETLARLWQRESMLLPVALYLDAHDAESSIDAVSAPLRRFLSRSEGLFFLSVREIWPRPGREAVTLDVAKPTPEEQREAWEAVLEEHDEDGPARLAGQFNLNLSDIFHIAQITMSEIGPQENSLPERIWESCRAHVRPRLDALAQRLNPKATWGDIVLPDDETQFLHQIAAQVNQRTKVYGEWGFARKMNRGLGISALFAGESGTGKTMAAEVIANDLGLNLYRIDLSAVVSKYIGETEKNLRRLFDAAEDGGAILFFDEADALFGKRSEVKDSHDRYANIEINYLLQRMEAYRGLAILATNMKSALDVAFTRRLRFIVSFPFPSLADRRLIWQKAFPPETPKGQIDYDKLGRLNLTGGSIHSAALNAAFLAAQAGTPVTMGLVLTAAKSEFIKMERPVNENDFCWVEPEGVVA